MRLAFRFGSHFLIFSKKLKVKREGDRIQAKDLEDAIKPLNKNGVIVLPQEAAMIANYGFGIRSRAFIIDFDCLRFGTKQDFFPLKSQFSIISPRLRSQSQSMDTEDD